ncbi:hypothetical protein KI385_06165 [Streptomyces inhibens]|nr:hypothetical protein KI385_06165 [Streptomyces inhibens]
MISLREGRSRAGILTPLRGRSLWFRHTQGPRRAQRPRPPASLRVGGAEATVNFLLSVVGPASGQFSESPLPIPGSLLPPAPGSWAPVPGSWVPAPGSWAPVPGSSVPVPGSWVPVPGSSVPVPAFPAPAFPAPAFPAPVSPPPAPLPPPPPAPISAPVASSASVTGWKKVSPPWVQSPLPPEVSPTAESPENIEPPLSPGSAQTSVCMRPLTISPLP